MSTEHNEPESADNAANPEQETSRGPETEEGLDEQVEESFPASDPPANY